MPTMKKLLATIALAILTGMVARAAQVGDTVFGFIPVETRVPLDVSNNPQEVMHITLDDGIWLVSGQINFLSLNTPAEPCLPRATSAWVRFRSIRLRPHRLPRNKWLGLATSLETHLWLPAQSKWVITPPVYLVAGSFNPNPNVTAWGFITAVKIRNHVD